MPPQAKTLHQPLGAHCGPLGQRPVVSVVRGKSGPGMSVLQSTTAATPAATPAAAPLQVGLVGFGYAGAAIHAPLISHTPGLRLAAVSSRDAARVHAALGPAVRVFADAGVLVASPVLDLVVIASPNPSHAPLAATALAAGRHVLIDKPMALTAAEAAPLLALAEQAQRLLSVFHNRRWDGDFLTAQALLQAGTLGRLSEARLQFDRFRPQVRPRWREGDGPGAGLWMDLAPHLIDQALQLFGWPRTLQADLATHRSGGRSDDAFDCRLVYADGLRVHLSASMLSALPGPRFALHGSRGSWVKHGLDCQEDQLKAGLRPDPQQPADWGADPQAGMLCCLAADAPDGSVPVAQPLANQAGRWPDFYRLLAAAIRGQAPNPVPPAQALQVLALMDLGRASHQQRRELALVQ